MQVATEIKSTVVPIMSTTKRVFARLLKWDISTIKQYAVQKGLYIAEEIDDVEIEYKKYLALCIGFPSIGFPTPLKLDDLWHQHILFAKDYQSMCQNVFGRFLHHSPFTDGRKADQAAKAKMFSFAQSEFGNVPEWAWGSFAGCEQDNCGSTDGPNSCEGSCEPGGGDPG